MGAHTRRLCKHVSRHTHKWGLQLRAGGSEGSLSLTTDTTQRGTHLRDTGASRPDTDTHNPSFSVDCFLGTSSTFLPPCVCGQEEGASESGKGSLSSTCPRWIACASNTQALSLQQHALSRAHPIHAAAAASSTMPRQWVRAVWKGREGMEPEAAHPLLSSTITDPHTHNTHVARRMAHLLEHVGHGARHGLHAGAHCPEGHTLASSNAGLGEESHCL